MRRSTQIILSTIAAASLVGEKIGGHPIAPGPNTRFDCSLEVSGADQTLQLRSDKGEFKCWIELWMHGQPTSGMTAECRIIDGPPLLVQVASTQSNAFELKITSIASDKGSFAWLAGHPIQVLLRNVGSTPINVADWRVYPVDDQYDSRWRAVWRTWWLWISVIGLIVSVGLAVSGALSKGDDVRESMSRACVAQLIEKIEGEDKKETKRMRIVLRKVILEGARLDEALDCIGPKGTDRNQVWFKARARFLERLRHLIDDLTQHDEHLRVK